MPNRVKRVAQFHYYSRCSENQRDDPKDGGGGARCRLISRLNQTLNCTGSFSSDQVLDLPYQLTLSRLCPNATAATVTTTMRRGARDSNV
jgi:hypothetical protein